jgi:hypothetical protein
MIMIQPNSRDTNRLLYIFLWIYLFQGHWVVIDEAIHAWLLYIVMYGRTYRRRRDARRAAERAAKAGATVSG